MDHFKMASNDHRNTLIKDCDKNIEYGSLDSESTSSINKPTREEGKVLLVEKNNTIFSFFKFFGLYVIQYRNGQYEMSEGHFIFVRFMWFLWHLGGVIVGIVIKTYVEQNTTQTINPWLMSSIYIFVFIIIDPIQTQILGRSLETLPDLLNGDIKELERQAHELFRATHRKVGLFPWERKVITFGKKKKLDSFDSHTSISRWNRFYRWEPVITLFILLTAFLVTFIYGFWLEAQWSQIKHESIMIVMCMYLIFPMLSTWFCVVFIEYERQLYKVINDDIEDKDFKDSTKIKDISNYIDLMQQVFKILTDKFFKFIFGMNSLIFVSTGIFCMYQLLDGFDDARKFFQVFGGIFYAIPLTLCCLHIFLFAKSSHDLINGQHQKLRLRLKSLLSELLLAGEDKQFKKVEQIYKNLKDYPPQAEIYGGYKVNYQILVGMFLFIFSYARIFKGILVERETTVGPSHLMTTEGFNYSTIIS